MAHRDKLKTTGVDTSHIKRTRKPECRNCKYKEGCLSKTENMIMCLRHEFEDKK